MASIDWCHGCGNPSGLATCKCPETAAAREWVEKRRARMKSDRVILAAKLLEEHIALHEAIGKVKKKVWVDRGDEEPVGHLVWHEARFDKLPFSQQQVLQILNDRLGVVNAALEELGVEL